MPETLRSAESVPDGPGGLRFTALTLAGLGPPLAPLGHALAWFEGHLYLAPAGVPGKPARIFRCDRARNEWTCVHESPLIPTSAGLFPREIGIRAMTVFKGTGDRAPCLYCGTISSAGGQILRSEDGLHFTPTPHLTFGAPALGSFARIGPWLAVLPEGQADGMLNLTSAARGTEPQVAQDPAAGLWTPAHESRMDGAHDPAWEADKANLAVAAMAVAHDALYAATTNPTRGFELWRTRVETTAPFRWEKVLDRGAGRFSENPSVAAMAAFGGDLWIGTECQLHDPASPTRPTAGPEGAAMRGGRRRLRPAARVRAQETAPAAAELIRIRADGSWDLIVGAPRFTPAGLKVPLSALGPGFGDRTQIAIPALAVHEGRLFAGTRQVRPRDGGIAAACALWSSADGTEWSALHATDQAGETGCIAVDSLCPTPEGLFLGLRREVTDLGLAGWAGGQSPAARAEGLVDEIAILQAR
jgi:hypothetical protein